MAVLTGVSPKDLEDLDLEVWNRMVAHLPPKVRRAHHSRQEIDDWE